jgi:hypothetical protein
MRGKIICVDGRGVSLFHPLFQRQRGRRKMSESWRGGGGSWRECVPEERRRWGTEWIFDQRENKVYQEKPVIIMKRKRKRRRTKERKTLTTLSPPSSLPPPSFCSSFYLSFFFFSREKGGRRMR